MKVILAFVVLFSMVLCEDFYELLGVSKNADDKEIRKAFKKLALVLHPDKNKNDEEANKKFLRVNRAYEVLKDEELRKKYDKFGEEGLSADKGQEFRPWDFYQHQFGLYDDDPEIVTLNNNEFEQSVFNSGTKWFINFYSPMCGHCHELAPEWRKLAQQLEGVVRIGAVNCEDAWMLCQTQRIGHFPQLRFYPGDKTHHQYRGEKSADPMVQYVLKKINAVMVHVKSSNLNYLSKEHPTYRKQSWILVFCKEDILTNCPDKHTLIKVIAMLEGSVVVGQVDCKADEELCKLIGNFDHIVFYPVRKIDKVHAIPVKSQEAREIAEEVVDLLPAPENINGNRMQEIMNKLERKKSKPWVIHFGTKAEKLSNLEMNKMPQLLDKIKMGQVSCDTEPEVCKQFHIAKHPTIIILKAGAVFELYMGRLNAHDIVNFAKDCSTATNIRSLNPSNFPNINDKSETWFIDYFLPWCPPCKRLLPEFRRASRMVGRKVKFGTVDCTAYPTLCNSRNIRSYPTTILYRHSKAHDCDGGNAEEIVEFVKDIFNPKVLTLTTSSWRKFLKVKPIEKLWVVDFFMPNCHPCRFLEPEWRKLAKKLSRIQNVHIGKVDCTEEKQLCETSKFRIFPTIRLYRLGTYGDATFIEYRGRNLDEMSLKSWIFNFIPSSVIILNDHNYGQVLDGTSPWLVYFWDPRNPFCRMFSAEFEGIAMILERNIKCGKLDCTKFPKLCHRARLHSVPMMKLFSRDDVMVEQGFNMPLSQEEVMQTLENEFSYLYKKKEVKGNEDKKEDENNEGDEEDEDEEDEDEDEEDEDEEEGEEEDDEDEGEEEEDEEDDEDEDEEDDEGEDEDDENEDDSEDEENEEDEEDDDDDKKINEHNKRNYSKHNEL